MIYKSDYFPLIIKNKQLFDEVKTFKSKYYRTSWSNVENSSLSNICIIPSEARLKEINTDYDKMKEMIFDNRPTFEEIIIGLIELEEKLRNI